MKLSVNWLNDYIDLTGISINELSDRLTLAGLEIEGRHDTKKINGIVTAKVLTKVKHPNADKLNLCTVSDGTDEYQIVCGAPNVDINQIVILAKVGAVLPEITIKEAKIRDILSVGMLCSSSELGIEDTSSGIIVLPPDTKIGIDANVILGLGDTILELNVTPNRPDWLSAIGVAREVSAIFNLPIKLPHIDVKKVAGKVDKYIKVEDVDNCPIYLARVIRNVKVGISPLWLQNRLRSAGLRSINNIVDITNYILLEFSQPLHAFDYDKINGGIIVRSAKQGEHITTLDDKDRSVDQEMLLITDELKALAIAGVMGGLDSSVTASTQNILLEIAYFKPESIRRTSKKLFLSSDSSYRYERGIDFGAINNLADYAVGLIQSVAGGDIIDVNLGGEFKKMILNTVTSDYKKINGLLGTNISQSDMLKYLNSLNIKSTADGDLIISNPPTYRVDIQCMADIAEEVARLYGYDNIEITVPALNVDPTDTPDRYKFVRGVRDRLSALGFNECINYSFLGEEYLKIFDNDDKKYVKLLNPISQDMALMRVLLFPSLLKNIETNWNQSVRSIKLYEIASTYNNVSKDKLAIEKEHIAFAVMGGFFPLHWSKQPPLDNFYYLKGVIENILQSTHLDYRFERGVDCSYLHPKRMADIFLNNKKIGFIGELHPLILEKLDLKEKVIIAELELEPLTIKIDDVISKSYKKFSRFQNSERDISIVVKNSIDAYDILNEVLKVNSKIIDVKIFDNYISDLLGADMKSIALRIELADMTKTLEDDEINNIITDILNRLKDKFSARLR